jgi:galactokinase
MTNPGRLITAFANHFGGGPDWLAWAPGRVNLIGEHTDYNGGYVLPVAIDRGIRMAARVRDDNRLRLWSLNYAAAWEMPAGADLTAAAKTPRGWHSYFVAVLHQFRGRGLKTPGLDVAIEGDLPPGAGLSSSAAYEVCAAVLLDAVIGAGLPRRDLALMAQAAEHSPFVGVRCGIMDQFASALGVRDHALFLDCHTMEHELVPFDPNGAAIVIINSMKRRGLVDSQYNQRRAECEAGLERLRDLAGEPFETLRHVPPSIFAQFETSLPETVRKRTRHTVTENARVCAFVEGLKRGDWSRLGKLLYESHASLRDDFEVSCAELDAIVRIASRCPWVYGCRMTGAGFGGCAVALVQPASVPSVCSALAREYTAMFKVSPEILVSAPGEGAAAERARAPSEEGA